MRYVYADGVLLSRNDWAGASFVSFLFGMSTAHSSAPAIFKVGDIGAADRMLESWESGRVANTCNLCDAASCLLRGERTDLPDQYLYNLRQYQEGVRSNAALVATGTLTTEDAKTANILIEKLKRQSELARLMAAFCRIKSDTAIERRRSLPVARAVARYKSNCEDLLDEMGTKKQFSCPPEEDGLLYFSGCVLHCIESLIQYEETVLKEPDYALTLAKTMVVRITHAITALCDAELAMVMDVTERESESEHLNMASYSPKKFSHCFRSACSKKLRPNGGQLWHCSGCIVARYCSQACQLADRESHAPFCMK